MIHLNKSEGMSASSATAAASSPFTLVTSSSIGRKFVMAVTGVLLLLFVIGHLVGNLQIFLGAEVFNAYAAFLQGLGAILWVVRAGLLFVFLVHVLMALQLRAINQSARPVGYQKQATLQASAASLYMLETGVVILLFVVLHLLHFTFKTLHPEFSQFHDAQGRHDAYQMVIIAFQDPLYAWSYIGCMTLLGMHLSHGISSAFHSLGMYNPILQPRIRQGGAIVGWGIAAGYISIPLAIQLGLVGGM